MTKRIHKEELLFDVNDKPKIKLGKDLHIPMIDPTDGLDWSVESLLIAKEIAMDDHKVDFPRFEDCIVSFEFSYYCKINGIRYKITEGRKDLYGSFYTKIELI